MQTYARIDQGVVFEFISTEDPIDTLFNPLLLWVDVTDALPAPSQGWIATESDGAWSFAAPPPPPVF
jgi:hypothetical protein